MDVAHYFSRQGKIDNELKQITGDKRCSGVYLMNKTGYESESLIGGDHPRGGLADHPAIYYAVASGFTRCVIEWHLIT